jgi:arylsulfatase
MKIYDILNPIVFLLLTICLSSSSSAIKTNPNIILVYLDDLGYGDLGVTGNSGYTTPNIDEMSRNGLLFTQFYSPQAVCTASRAGLLTGCYPNRIGFSGAMDHTSTKGLHEDEETIAEILKVKGYNTAVFGKWHLGHHQQFLPLAHGFDEFYGIPYSNDMWPNHPVTKNYYPPLPLFSQNNKIQENPDQSNFTTDFTKKTLDFIDKNSDQSFFIYLAHPMPHVPLFVSDKFKGKSKQGLYGDVIMEIDWSIGQIRDHLKKRGLSDNTLLILTSDNGPWINYGNHAGSTGGLREGKGSTYDGGQKVPCIMEWPGIIPKGKVCNQLASAIDILPTICEITDSKLPHNTIDGVSLLELLKGNVNAEPRKNFAYYYRQNNLEAVRYGDWKLVFPHPGRTYEGFNPGGDGIPGSANENFNFGGGLYDLRRDPGERYNVQYSNTAMFDTLTTFADSIRTELGDNLKGVQGKGRRKIGDLK